MAKILWALLLAMPAGVVLADEIPAGCDYQKQQARAQTAEQRVAGLRAIALGIEVVIDSNAMAQRLTVLGKPTKSLHSEGDVRLCYREASHALAGTTVEKPLRDLYTQWLKFGISPSERNLNAIHELMVDMQAAVDSM